MQVLMILISGILFAFGLGISGMTQPEKVTGFLDILGDWDPSLIMVMLGASGSYMLGYLMILRRPVPVFADGFKLPTRRDIDPPLLIGSALFGTGWGLVGFCPGPALVSMVTGQDSVVIFVLSMAIGMYLFGALEQRFILAPGNDVALDSRAAVE